MPTYSRGRRSAENLGKLHLESGMLNSIAFQFEMNDEKATGKIMGEYHDLVVDKLKENNNDNKVDKMMSWALKKFIIPRDKDKSLPVGVKSSFKLGFLLPG